MGESAYRGSDETLRATLGALMRQAGETSARVERGYLERYDLARLARLNEQARVAAPWP